MWTDDVDLAYADLAAYMASGISALAAPNAYGGDTAGDGQALRALGTRRRRLGSLSPAAHTIRRTAPYTRCAR